MAAEPAYAACAKLDRSIACLAALRRSIDGALPHPAAEALLDDIEDHFDIVGVKLKRALAIMQTEIEHIEALEEMP